MVHLVEYVLHTASHSHTDMVVIFPLISWSKMHISKAGFGDNQITEFKKLSFPKPFNHEHNFRSDDSGLKNLI